MTPIVLANRYQLQEKISAKAGRQTYRAIDLQTQQAVIVKLLIFDEEFDWTSLRLFEREIAVLRSLQHPDIPAYLDAFDVDGPNGKGFGLVQTYIAAPSLESYLKQGYVFSEAEIYEIAIRLLEVLSFLHRKNPPVIHRDIKPSNILLKINPDDQSIEQVYLVDFGSVQTMRTPKNQTMTIVGTYGYMPPEQFGGKASSASDLYSLGATLLYLVTGQHPTELINENLEFELEDIPQISLHFENWLRRMVETIPSRRFSSADAAIEALEDEEQDDFDEDDRDYSEDFTRTDEWLIKDIPAKDLPLEIRARFDHDYLEIMTANNRHYPVRERKVPKIIFFLIFIAFCPPVLMIPVIVFALLIYLIKKILIGSNNAEIIEMQANPSWITLVVQYDGQERTFHLPYQHIVKVVLQPDPWARSKTLQRSKITVMTKGRRKYLWNNLDSNQATQLARELSDWFNVPLNDFREPLRE
ncbi:MAG: hypothetical protein B0A82_15335 [Alkalinema sp. CACIAM 70d]|nr:MAG: hypothetical protein B0A82_15335 [Alkalinema sp. CACIAM 70d]